MYCKNNPSTTRNQICLYTVLQVLPYVPFFYTRKILTRQRGDSVILSDQKWAKRPLPVELGRYKLQENYVYIQYFIFRPYTLF